MTINLTHIRSFINPVVMTPALTRSKTSLSQHHTLTQCWFIVGPASQTVDRHRTNIRLSLSCLLENVNAEVAQQAGDSDPMLVYS